VASRRVASPLFAPRRNDRAEQMTTLRRARSRFLVLCGAILFVAIACAMVIRSSRGPVSDHKRGGGRSSTAEATARAALEARRIEARKAIRDGRFDVAFAVYRSLADGCLEAEEFCRLGSVLLERGRIVPGWAALEAARRIDREHAATRQALDAFQTRLALAMGQERVLLQAAAARVELLLSVPGGPHLGMLILGLVRYASDPDQETEFLDRLVARDRSVLLGLTSRGAAIRLIARLLLEMGRPEDAGELLRERVAISSEPRDREAAWLLGRAALQLGQRETADEMLALAGDIGETDLSSPEPAPFVGSERCRDCHLRIYREQQTSSRHALTLRFASALKTVPLPTRPVADPVIPHLTHTFSRQGDDRIDLEARIADRVIHAIVEYAVGSGRHGITMVAKDDAGVDRELRISYLSEGRSWGKTKGIDRAPQDAGEHVGPALSPQSLRHCLNCHATWFRSADLDRPGSPRPVKRDHGIGCERCHGPGLNHVKAVETGFAELAIAQTSATPALARLKSCTECHAADGSVEASDPEFTRAQGTTLLFSKCFTATKGQINCTTCHDPHRSLEESIPPYEARCLSCHTSNSPHRDAQAPREVAGRGVRKVTTCPVNPVANCISCHMPKVEDMSRRSRFTDHHIRVHHEPGSAREFDKGQ
jgi:tetratricopeptide (TPR) repeat protein